VDTPRKSFNKDTQLVTAVTRKDGEIDAFLIGDDGQVWNAWRQGDTWRWDKLPDNIKFTQGTRQVTAVSMRDKIDAAQDTLVVFAIGDDNRIWQAVLDGRHWEDWTPLPPLPLRIDHRSQAVAAVSRKAGKLDLFVIGTDGERKTVLSASWEKDQNDDEWGNWFSVPPRDGITFDGAEHVSAVARSPLNLDLFVVSGGKIYNTHWDDRSNTWANWAYLDYVSPEEKSRRTPLPTFLDSQPVTAISKSGALETTDLDLFAVNSLKGIWSNWWQNGKNNSEWYGWFHIGYGYFHLQQRLAVVARSPKNLDVFGLDTKGRLLMTYWRDPQNTWSDLAPPKNLEGPEFSLNQQVAAVTPAATELDLFVIGNDGQLWTSAWHG
jgi:hypothetical protein